MGITGRQWILVAAVAAFSLFVQLSGCIRQPVLSDRPDAKGDSRKPDDRSLNDADERADIRSDLTDQADAAILDLRKLDERQDALELRDADTDLPGPTDADLPEPTDLPLAEVTETLELEDGITDIPDDGSTELPDLLDGQIADGGPDAEDADSEDIPPDANGCSECTEGQIKCQSETAYANCIESGGCWTWGPSAECSGENQACACKELLGKDICTGVACVCAPQCEDKKCGDDGCGGSCGACAEGKTCHIGECCEPKCGDKECGDDGCGGECVCPGAQDECIQEVCICQPACQGKECGDDGCDGTCGGDTPCVDGNPCTEDSCVAETGLCSNELIYFDEVTDCGWTKGNGKGNVSMCLVPFGCFEMGKDAPMGDYYGDTHPEHTVYMDSYYIDQYEVRNEHYKAFLDSPAGVNFEAPDATCGNHTGCSGKPWENGYPELLPTHPVVCVTWDQANAYCQWAGKTLPTEAQWEKAARGVYASKYPWGNDGPSCDKTNYDTCYGATKPVGSYDADVSPYGVLDMAGNVMEWCIDFYDPNYYCHPDGQGELKTLPCDEQIVSNPVNSHPYSEKRVRRGGAWCKGTEVIDFCAAYNRQSYKPTSYLNYGGFRCAYVPCDPECEAGKSCVDGKCECPKDCMGQPCGADDSCGGICKCAPGEGPCETDDQCEDNAFCLNGICEAVICDLSGTQGDKVDCPLHLARGAKTYETAVMFQLTLNYDETLASVDSLVVCGELDPPFNFDCTLEGSECDPLGAPVFCSPATLTCFECTAYQPEESDIELSGGHSVQDCAQPPDECEDGKLDLVVWGTENLPVTTAYLEEGSVAGASEVLTVRFNLLTDTPEKGSVPIGLTDLVFTDAQADLLHVEVQHSSAPDPEHFIVTGVTQ